jgi:hypothetical protein
MDIYSCVIGFSFSIKHQSSNFIRFVLSTYLITFFTQEGVG